MCASFSEGRTAFEEYFGSAYIADVYANLPNSTLFGHLFYSRGFFKRIVEILGRGDEDDIADQFEIIRDPSKTKREKRKALERFESVLAGQPIRSSSPIWLYRDPVIPANRGTMILDEGIDACLPWRLALPIPNGSFIHLIFSTAALTSKPRVPNCCDAGFDKLDLWKHGGLTAPISPGPTACNNTAGLSEILTESAVYDRSPGPLGYCIAAILP
jgi:hypothetical protein